MIVSTIAKSHYTNFLARFISNTINNNTAALKVRDDGTGIASGQIVAGNSFGIMGMRERITLLDGSFNIEGIPGNGTTVLAELPLGGKDRD